MEDRTAASAGFVAAGLALAGTLLPWPGGLAPVATAAAAGGTLAFGLRRHGALDRRAAASIAGLSGLAVLALGLSAILLATGMPSGLIGPGPGLAAAAGGLAAVAAYTDWRSIPRDRLVVKARAALSASAVGVSGLVAIVVWSVLLGSVAPRGPAGEIDPRLGTALSVLALGLGTGSVAAIYLRASDRSLAYLDVSVPGRRDLGIVVGGVVAIVAANLGLGYALQFFGVESATHAVIRAAESDPGILLVLIPLSYLIVGPGEELLYRNVVQKSLYGAFSRRAAVVVASAIFAGVHIFAYSDPASSTAATIATLLVIFVLALVLGTAYERTRNVVVAALIHGSFNAIAFAVTYVELVGGL